MNGRTPVLLALALAVACPGSAAAASAHPLAKLGVQHNAVAGSPCDGKWHAVASQDVAHKYGDYNSLSAVAALSTSQIWAVGFYNRFADYSYYHTLSEYWNGTAWMVVPTVDSAMPNNVFSAVAAVAPNDVWAMGYEGPPSGYYYTLIEHWDGTAWKIAQDGTVQGFIRGAAATASNDVWAVGSTGYVGEGLIEHWDGARWKKTLLHGAIVLNSVVALSPSDVWAVGFKSTRAGSGEGDDTFTVHFDGTKWTHVRSPSPLHTFNIDQNWLTAVTAIASNDVWAVGVTRDTDYGILDQTLTEHWDGTRWRVVASRNPGGPGMYDDLWGVAVLDSSDLYAVGEVGESTFSPIEEHWDAVKWRNEHAPSLQGALQAVAQAGGAELWAVGNRVRRLERPQYIYNGTLVEHLCFF
jgi:hypothetical protein